MSIFTWPWDGRACVHERDQNVILLLNSLHPELLEDILREKPQEADGIDSVVVVDNVPQVGPERVEKLKNVIHKIFSKFGKITNEFYPDVEGKTKG